MSSSSLKTGVDVLTAPKTSSFNTEKCQNIKTDTTNLETNSKIDNNNSKTSNIKEEEICDDWEQLDQQKIEKSLQSIKINSNLNNRSNDDEEKTFKNENNQSNSNMPPFTFINNQFPPQSIKILKRPASNKKLNEMVNPNQNSNLVSQPIKTFEQREQEYAQARLRILGSAHPEEDSNSNTNQTNNTTYQNIPKNNSSSTNLNSLNQTNKIGFNLIRDPLAPDGTKGFKNNTNKNC